MFGSWVLNEIWIIDLSSSLFGMLMSPSKLFLFFERSSLQLRCATVIVTVLCFSHHACCLLYIWAKLTVAFTFTSFPFNLNTCVIGCGCGFGFKQKFWRIDGFGEIKARNGGFAYPYSPPSLWHAFLSHEYQKIYNSLPRTQDLELSSCLYYQFVKLSYF